MAAEYRLHCFAESGNSYKVALMLQACGADWEPLGLDFFAGAARAPEFLGLNPMGEAPVLEGPDGVTTQSGVILKQLSARFMLYGGDTPNMRDEILRWILWDNHKLTSYTATQRFLRRFAPESARDPAVIAFFDGRRRAAMKTLERRLTALPFVAGADGPSIADFSCCGYLFWLDDVGDDIADWPAIGAWLERLKNEPGWAPAEQLMPPAWKGA